MQRRWTCRRDGDAEGLEMQRGWRCRGDGDADEMALSLNPGRPMAEGISGGTSL